MHGKITSRESGVVEDGERRVVKEEKQKLGK